MVHNTSSSVQSLSHLRLFVTQWTTEHQASLSIRSSQSLLKLMSIELVMPSNHLDLYPPFLLLPSIFPSIRVLSNESVLPISWPKYWSFGFNISLSHEYSGLVSFIFHLFEFLASNVTPPTSGKILSVPLSQAWISIPTSHTNANAKQGPVGFQGTEAFLSTIPCRQASSLHDLL